MVGTVVAFVFVAAVASAGADARSWRSHVDEFRAVRDATLPFLLGLPDEAWGRRGVASGNPFTVRALAFIAAGHVTHHLKLLQERYAPLEFRLKAETTGVWEVASPTR
jgi:hypothetical protein